MAVSTLIHAVLVLTALFTFIWVMHRRVAVLKLAAPDPRLDHIWQRIGRMLVIGFGQSRQPRYLVAGVLHILIFAGFLILSIRSLTLLGEGFTPGFTLPGLHGAAGDLYAVFKDITALVVLIACIMAIVRRLIFRPIRYHDRNAEASHSREAYVILGLISLLMVADAFYEGSDMLFGNMDSGAMPLAGMAATALDGYFAATLTTVHSWSFWIHNITLLFFLCYLPVSKHFHVVTAIPNVFLSKLKIPGEIKPPRHGVRDLDKLEQLGVGSLEDFTWKQILDFYTCTDCGRCSDYCPAYTIGTPLSPRMISIKCRDLVYERYPVFGKTPNGTQRTALVTGVIGAPELWACTTCGACEEACPVMIEYVDKIVDMRRYLVDKGDVPKALQKPLSDLEQRGNPYGKPARQRADWLNNGQDTEPGIRLLGAGEKADLLFFADSTTSYDPRIQEIGQAMSRILKAADEDCGTLGEDEVDSGNDVRRIGEEGLFEELRRANLDALASRDFDRVVTTDPHALNALRNDGYDLDLPVLHHSQLLAELIRSRKLELKPMKDDRVYTFHDPCFLGRHNGVYDAPREVLKALPGLKTVEMKRSRNRSFCCGGGMLSLYYEGEGQTRMGEKRLEMAASAGAQVVVTACPFCMINLEDAVKTAGRSDEMQIIDLAELVARSLSAGPALNEGE